jgi:hypothetical protein
MSNGTFRLVERFKNTFFGTRYDHRNSSLGNIIGRELFEDLVAHSGSAAYVDHVQNGRTVVNRGGKIHTPKAIRRNDSILGRPPAGVTLAAPTSGFSVFEGSVAEPRLGCELKILAKSQLKQIGRVISDLERFADRMKSLNQRCINVAVVGVNHESDYVGWEGDRPYRHKLTASEPETVSARLSEALLNRYDELLIFRFRATNQLPYPFSWVDPREVDLDYGAALTRAGELYQSRFG